MNRSLVSFMGFALACATGASSAWAQQDAFYKGKTVEILVGFSPGGGYDAYARALSSVIGKHIPGNPTIVVRNMTGAGSLRLALYLSSAAPKDGTSFGIFDNGLMIAPLLKPDTMKFNASKLGWVGSTAKDTQVCMVWGGTGIKNVQQMRSKETAFAVTGLDDIRYMSTAMLRSVGGARINITPGYPGSTDIRLAIERGEIEGVCDSWQSVKSTKSDWITDKKVNFVVQMTATPIKDLPDVPTITSFAENVSVRAALDLLVAPGEAGRSFAAPPDVPSDRLNILRRAFDESVKDKEFLDTTAKGRLEVDPMKGEEIESFLRRVYSASPENVALARKLVE
jgi:tripartite-type tricarboxylate transporter receptor subunit TctC